MPPILIPPSKLDQAKEPASLSGPYVKATSNGFVIFVPQKKIYQQAVGAPTAKKITTK